MATTQYSISVMQSHLNYMKDIFAPQLKSNLTKISELYDEIINNKVLASTTTNDAVQIIKSNIEDYKTKFDHILEDFETNLSHDIATLQTKKEETASTLNS